MKTISKFCLIFATSAAMLAGCAVRGGFVVHDRPADVVYERGTAPYADAVWVGDEWEWRGSRYEHVNGHWEHSNNRVWVSGSWRQTNGGYTWDKGHWQ